MFEVGLIALAIGGVLGFGTGVCWCLVRLTYQQRLWGYLRPDQSRAPAERKPHRIRIADACAEAVRLCGCLPNPSPREQRATD